DVQAGTIQKVVQQGETLSVFTKAQEPGATEPAYTVNVPNVLTQVSQDIVAAAAKGGNAQPTFDPKVAPDNSWIGLVLTGLLPLIIIGGFIYFVMRQAHGTNNQALSFGKSRAGMFLGNEQV